MAYIRKRNGQHRVEIYRDGGRIRDSATFGTRREAEDWAAARESELLSGAALPSRRTLAAVIADYIDAVVPAMRSQKPERVRLGVVARSGLGARAIGTIEPAHIAAWRDERGRTVKPGTVLREMTTLRGVLEYARRDLGLIDKNPIGDVRRPPEPPARKRLMSDAERDAIAAALGYKGVVRSVQHETAVAMLLSLETAMRGAEITGLTWARVDLVAQVAALDVTKNGDRREVPLSRRAVALLSAMHGRRLDRVRRPRPGFVFHVDAATMGTLFRRARDRLAQDDPSIASLHFHDARATAITRLSKILSPLELARMTGHRDLSSLMVYYREGAASIAARLG